MTVCSNYVWIWSARVQHIKSWHKHQILFDSGILLLSTDNANCLTVHVYACTCINIVYAMICDLNDVWLMRILVFSFSKWYLFIHPRFIQPYWPNCDWGHLLYINILCNELIFLQWIRRNWFDSRFRLYNSQFKQRSLCESWKLKKRIQNVWLVTHDSNVCVYDTNETNQNIWTYHI